MARLNEQNSTGRKGNSIFHYSPRRVARGGPGGEYLYVTHDGMKSWEQVCLESPPQAHPAIYAIYDSPTFKDSQHGVLPVTYRADPKEFTVVVQFVTNDGGRTWAPGPMLTDAMSFDQCAADTSANMGVWWNSSPYYDTGIYIGGNSRSSCPQPNLTSSWVQTVLSQGWGLMPLWPGP